MKIHWHSIIIFLIVTLVVTSGIKEYYQKPIPASVDAINKMEAEDAARKLLNARTMATRTREREERLLAVWGDPLDAAMKNPANGISAMLKALGIACTPQGSDVKVTVDRFTEFRMEINLAAKSAADIPAICLNILRRGLPYLASLRVVQKGIVVADLDQPLISSQTDWSMTTLAEMKVILAKNAVGTLDQNNPPATGAETKSDEVEPSPEQLAIKRAFAAYNSLFSENQQRLADVENRQIQSIQFSEVRSIEDMQAKAVSLRTNQEDLNALADFFVHSSNQLKSELTREKVDPLLATILVRKQARVEAQEAPYWQDLFNSLNGFQNECSAMVDLMTRGYGSWEMYQGKYRFAENNLMNAFNNLSPRIQTAAELVGAKRKQLEQKYREDLANH